MFGDPVPGEQKSCYCEPEERRKTKQITAKYKLGLDRREDLCARELGKCECEGTVFFGSWGNL